MGDLAGVRIGLYLPADILKVTKEIEKCFQIEHLFGTVTGGRNIAQGRNLDIEKHTSGPWQSKDLEGTDEYWEHYGYKPWQMVVTSKGPHPGGTALLRVEIQVGTVVTQAWAEVQHNIIYKRSADMLATTTMKRMIDAINGLAITTEIMLKELEQKLEEHAREKAEYESQKQITTGTKFLSWFQITYLSQMGPEERQRWDCSPHYAEHLLKSWITKGAPTSSPNNLKCLIEQKGLLQSRTKAIQKLDISLLMLRALGDTRKYEEPNLSPLQIYQLPPSRLSFDDIRFVHYELD